MEDPYPVENIDRLGDLMFQTSDKSQLLRRVLWINAQLTIVWSLKHKISQPIYIFNRENSQNSESPNGPRRELDFIVLNLTDSFDMGFDIQQYYSMYQNLTLEDLAKASSRHTLKGVVKVINKVSLVGWWNGVWTAEWRNVNTLSSSNK